MLTLLIFLAVLSVLVFVHEFGHFIAARLLGTKVEEFGFGFPPRLFGIKRGETTYSINWIPLGGFVRLKGESGDFRHEHDSFAGKKIWQRMVMVSAGVVMNFVLAAVLFTAGFIYGMPQNTEDLPAGARVRDASVMVGRVLEGSPAAEAGFVMGDSVLVIDGQEFAKIEELQFYINERLDQETKWQIERGEEAREIAVTPTTLVQTGKPGIGVGLFSVGTVSYPWYLAPARGVELTVGLTGEILRAFGHVITGLVKGEGLAVDLAGPVGIAVFTGQVAALGFVALIQFVAILSINLAIINFVPFPALDGGRFLFLVIETIRGKPVGQKLETAIHQIGFALLLALILLITYRDLIRFSDSILGGLRSLF